MKCFLKILKWSVLFIGSICLVWALAFLSHRVIHPLWQAEKQFREDQKMTLALTGLLGELAAEGPFRPEELPQDDSQWQKSFFEHAPVLELNPFSRDGRQFRYVYKKEISEWVGNNGVELAEPEGVVLLVNRLEQVSVYENQAPAYTCYRDFYFVVLPEMVVVRKGTLGGGAPPPYNRRGKPAYGSLPRNRETGRRIHHVMAE